MAFDKKRYVRNRRNRYKKTLSPVRQMSGFADQKKLHYMINVLEFAGKVIGESTLESVLVFLSTREKKGIIKGCIERAKKLKLDREQLFSAYLDGSANLDDSIVHICRNTNFKRLIYNDVLDALTALYSKKKSIPPNDIIQKKLSQVSEIFDLNLIEAEVILFLFLRENHRLIDRTFDELCDYLDFDKYKYPAKNFKPVSIMTDLERTAVRKALSSSSNLDKAGIVNEEKELAGEIINFLHGNNSKPMSQKYFSEFSDKAVPLQYHTIDTKHITTVKTLREHKSPAQGLNILLYGQPGTGKTEFARSLGRHLDMNIYEIKNMSEEDKNINMFRYRALMACQRMVPKEQSVIVVDEADALLNATPAFFSFTPVAEKGQINKVLDESTAFIIWITNRYDGIDESTKRRFDYSIGFEKLTFKQRRTIWQRIIKKHRMVRCFSTSDMDRLASQYEISAGGIDIALRNASRIYRKSRSKQGIMDIIENIIKAHMKILDQKETKEIKKANSPSYSLEGLHIKGDIEQTIALVDRFNAYWGLFGDEMEEVRNTNMLLYGPPGTGKTEFAKYIARRMNRRLIIKRASDLLNMYVGETEKLIKRAFMEAENDKSILFIDEADSFFGNRENAVRSWEITQVNEILTNMERFSGMLICATNFKEIVDSAAIRRFNIKLEFDYCTPEGAVTFYNVFMKRLIKKPLSKTEKAELGAIPCLTPGDFKIVNQKYYFFDDQKITHRELIGALRNEVACKNGNVGKVIGFGKS